jgi:dipeptidyl aminopeptidase/acylaminoacyl peptidase
VHVKPKRIEYLRYAIMVCLLLSWQALIVAQQAEKAGFDDTPLRIPTIVKDSPRPVTSMDLLRLRDLHGVSISPNGKHIAFVLGQAIHETNSYRSGLFVVGTELGNIPIALGSIGPPSWDVINQWLAESPQWSVDSRHIFCRMRASNAEGRQVWRWDLSGGPPMQLTHISGNVTKFEVTTDGLKLVYTVEKARAEAKIRQLSEHGILYDGSFPVWHRQSIVSEKLRWDQTEAETWIYDFSSQHERKATIDEIRLFGPWVSDLGEQIINKPGDSLEGHHILDAKISPDRSMVVYRYLDGNPTEIRAASAYELFCKPFRGGTPRKLTPESLYIGQYWWNADGDQIFYELTEGNGHSRRLMVVSVAAGEPKQVLPNRETVHDCSPDKSGNHLACVRESNISPPQVAFIDLVSRTVRTVVDVNPEFGNIQLGAVVRLEGTNKYGDQWFGHLVTPPSYRKDYSYPLIITTYRSSDDQFLRGASGDENPIQVYAAHGFAVLSFDPGVDTKVTPGNFGEALRQWASPVASMEMAINGLSRAGVIDPERVGVSGYSYGETIVGYAISHTNMFKAAIGGGGYDPYFYYMSPNSFHKIFADWGLGGWPEGEARDKWHTASPTLLADRINTPLLNNDGDFEGLADLALFTSLKELRKPAELFFYAGELHHKNQPKHRYEIYERNLDWFKFWLKSEESLDVSKKDQYERWHHLHKWWQQAHASAKPSPGNK